MSMTYEEQRTERERLYDAVVMERVKRGIALLEREHGPDWVDRIDMKTLSLQSASACVLGQVYAEAAFKANEEADPEGGQCWDGYDYVIDHEIMGINLSNDHEYGFSVHNGGFGREWDALQEAWEDALAPLVNPNA